MSFACYAVLSLIHTHRKLPVLLCIKQHGSGRRLHATSSLPIWASGLKKLGKLHANTLITILRDILDLQAEE